jgi:hypothetical protein
MIKSKQHATRGGRMWLNTHHHKKLRAWPKLRKINGKKESEKVVQPRSLLAAHIMTNATAPTVRTLIEFPTRKS